MSIALDILAHDGSTLALDLTFLDEDGNQVTPNDITWTLTNGNGAVVNGRSNVSATPASTITIVLSGDDLDVDVYGTRRVLHVLAHYDSSLGTGLPLAEDIVFDVEDLED